MSQLRLIHTNTKRSTCNKKLKIESFAFRLNWVCVTLRILDSHLKKKLNFCLVTFFKVFFLKESEVDCELYHDLTLVFSRFYDISCIVCSLAFLVSLNRANFLYFVSSFSLIFTWWWWWWVGGWERNFVSAHAFAFLLVCLILLSLSSWNSVDIAFVQPSGICYVP